MKINVSGFNPCTGEFISGATCSRVDNAVREWFKLNKTYPTCISIDPSNEEDAMEILRWANEHTDKLVEWSKEFSSPYKVSYLIDAVSNKVKRGKSGLSFYPDQLYPFCLG